jgi:dUTPase
MASENAAVLLFVKLANNALPLTRESSRASGFDLRSAYDVVIHASRNVLVKTDGKNYRRDVMGELHRVQT